MMRKEKSRARRYLALMAAAGAVAICAAAVQALPAGAQTVHSSRTAAGSANAPALRPVHLGVSAGSDNNTLYAICLTNDNTHCLAWGPNASIVLDSSANPIIEWKIVSNGTDETFESLGVSSGTTANDGLCLAAAANSSGGNNRVYATSN